MNSIRDAIVQHVQVRHEEGNEARGAELSREKPQMLVSQIGHCPRLAVFEVVRYHPDRPLHVAPTHPFDDYVLEIMEAGNAWKYQQATCISRPTATARGGRSECVALGTEWPHRPTRSVETPR